MTTSHPSTPQTHPGVNRACSTCQGSGLYIHPAGEYAAAESCSCVTECPLCNGTSFQRIKRDGTVHLQRCACTRVDGLLERYNRALIPGRMASKGLYNFNFADVSTNVAVEVSRYLAEFDPSQMNTGLVFYGKVGRGKTHLMSAMVRELILLHNVTARFVEFSHLLADLKSNFGRGEGAAALIEPLVRVDVLAIDELGKGRNTEFEGTVLDELVSRRYNAGRTILATTNYAPVASTGVAAPDFSTGVRPALVDRVGDRVYSRLQEMCHMVHMDGADYRQRIADGRKNGGRI